MNEQWTLFEGRQFRRHARSEPRVTLDIHSQISMNAVAFETLGEPQAVELLYDGNRRLIGVRPADPKKRNAFKVTAWGRSNYRRVMAAAFCQHFRLRYDCTLQFEKVDFDASGMLLLDLNQVSRVTRGAR